MNRTRTMGRHEANASLLCGAHSKQLAAKAGQPVTMYEDVWISDTHDPHIRALQREKIDDFRLLLITLPERICCDTAKSL